MKCYHHAAQQCDCAARTLIQDQLLDDFFDVYMKFLPGRFRHISDHRAAVAELEAIYYRLKEEFRK